MACSAPAASNAWAWSRLCNCPGCPKAITEMDLGITPGLGGQLVQGLASVSNLVGRGADRHPAVPPLNRSFEHILGRATQNNGRMRLLGRLGKALDRGKVIIPAVIFGLVRSPQLFHGQDRIPGLGPAVRKVSAHDLTLFFLPAGANAKQETSARIVIQRGDLLGQQQRVALRHEANPGAQLDLRGRGRGPSQRHKRVGNNPDRSRNRLIRSHGIAHGGMHRQNRMFRDPKRGKAQFFGLFRHHRRVRRLAGRETEYANVHMLSSLPGFVLPSSVLRTVAQENPVRHMRRLREISVGE